MESNGLSGGMFSNLSSGMLGLEMPLHHPQPQQNPHNLHPPPPPPQMVAFNAHDSADHHQQSQPNNPLSMKQQQQPYPYGSKPKPPQQQPTISTDEDEPGFHADDISGEGNTKKMSPWQRMKWTDAMVRLLIMAVYYIGDEVGGQEGNDKKKAGGLLQKKGKWKSVSRAMMEKGYYVSPQQCEDKFNDLNKRYKRVNDILGKGTACRVVENQSLLDQMDHLSPKMKDEVRKLLNSKHLFFREMCAYHNSCGSASNTGASSHPSRETAAAEEAQPGVHHHQQQRCLHAAENGSSLQAVSGRSGTPKLAKSVSTEDDEDDGDDEYDDEDDDEDEVDDAENGHGHEEEDDHPHRNKRIKKGNSAPGIMSSPLVQQISGDLAALIQDGTKSPWEKKQWMRNRLMRLEEEKVGHQLEAFELEKQRLKWVKFSSKKERDMERAKLKNERMRLETERMVLMLRQKEIELVELQQQQQSSNNKRGDPSPVGG